jgi:hypothetical protein
VIKGKDVELYWRDNSGDEVGFEIVRSVQVDGACVNYPVAATMARDRTSWVDTTTEKKNTYCYKVRALGEAGNHSGWTETVVITP